MTETRHRTVIGVEVQNKGVQALGKEVRAALDPKLVEQFTDALERSSRVMEQISEHSQETRNALLRSRRVAPPALPFRGQQHGPTGEDRLHGILTQLAEHLKGKGGGSDDKDSSGKRIRDTAAGTFLGNTLSRWGSRVGNVAGASASTSGFTQSVAGAIPLVGPAAAGMIGGVMEAHEAFASDQRAQMGMVGATGRTLDNGGQTFATIGRAYGMTGAETSGALGEFAQRSGLRGGGLTPDAFAVHMRMQNLLGVSNAGAVVAGQGAAGGQSQGAARLMQQAVETGLQAGIRSSRLDGFLQSVGSWVEEARTKGLDFSADSALQIVRAYAALGPRFVGEAGAKFAQQVTGGLQSEVSTSNIGTSLRLQAARQLAGPNADVMDVLERAESGSPEMQAAVQQLVRRNFRGMPLLARDVMKQMGFGEASLGQVRGYLDSPLDMTQGSERGAALTAGLTGRAADQFRDVAAPAQIRAGFESERVALGRKSASAAHAVERADLNMAEQSIPLVAPVVKEAAELLGGAIKIIGTDVGGAIKEAAEYWGKQWDEWKEDIGEKGFFDTLFGKTEFQKLLDQQAEKYRQMRESPPPAKGGPTQLPAVSVTGSSAELTRQAGELLIRAAEMQKREAGAGEANF